MNSSSHLDTMSVQEILEEAFRAFDEDRLQEAESLYLHCLTRMTNSDTDEYRNVLHMLAFVKSHQKQFHEARQIYCDLLDNARQRGDLISISVNLHQLGMVERLAGQYTDAQQLFETEHQHLLQNLPEFVVGLSANAYERGYIQLLQGNAAEAATTLRESLKHAEIAEDAICRACALRGLGEVYLSLGQVILAREHLNQSASIFRLQGDEQAATKIDDMMRQIID